MRIQSTLLLCFVCWLAAVTVLAAKPGGFPDENERTPEELEEDARLKSEHYEFLNEIFIKPEIIKLKTGLLFEVMKKTDNIFAKSPGPKDYCDVAYISSCANGTVFENATKSRYPDQLIPGWKQAMQLMAEGDRWKMYLSYQLAFGENGIPGKIPRFAPLVYELELIKCKESSHSKSIADARKALEEALLPPERDPTSPHYVIQSPREKEIATDMQERAKAAATAAKNQQQQQQQQKQQQQQDEKKKESDRDGDDKAAKDSKEKKKKAGSSARVGFSKKKRQEDDGEL